MAIPDPIRSYRCALLRVVVPVVLLALALTACAEADPDDPAADEADREPAQTNLTDACVEEFDPEVDYFPDTVDLAASERAEVTYHGHYKLLELGEPHQGAAQGLTVALVQCGTPEPDVDADLTVEVPVESVAALTTVIHPHLDLIDRSEALTAVATADFVATEASRERIEAGEVDEVGEVAEDLDLETLVAAGPDVALADSALDEGQAGVLTQASDAGVPTLPLASWLESDPLARASWLKVTALLLNEEAAAEQAYAEIVGGYTDLADRVAAEVDDEQRPSVLVETPFEGTWYVPGGESDRARMIDDAGGHYPWADEPGTASLPLDLEEVLDVAGDAEVWLAAGSVHGTLDDLAAIDGRFAEIDAFEQGEVYARDALANPAGQPAVLEVGSTRVDWQLADLVAILHPDLAADHELVFYGPVGAAR